MISTFAKVALLTILAAATPKKRVYIENEHMVSCDPYVDQDDPIGFCEEIVMVNPFHRVAVVELTCGREEAILSIPAGVKLTAVVQLAVGAMPYPQKCSIREITQQKKLSDTVTGGQ